MISQQHMIRHFEKVLAEAAKQRSQRPEGWIVFEREAMWRATNEERCKLGKQPVPIKALETVEMMAVGHVDYALKYALYCTEMVLKP